MIKDIHDRKKLSEGRNYGLGFAFLKKLKNNYECIMPITACKDYLNDVIFTEKTGISISAYGLTSEKNNIFEKDKGYLVLSTLHYKNGSKYSDFDEEKELLNNNYKNLQVFLNKFEELLGWEKSILSFVEDNMILVELSINWCKTTYGISLYTLLCRVGRWYDGEENVLSYLENFDKFSPDVYLCTSSLPKIKKFIENKPIEQDFDIKKILENPITFVHNKGILNYE